MSRNIKTATTTKNRAQKQNTDNCCSQTFECLRNIKSHVVKTTMFVTKRNSYIDLMLNLTRFFVCCIFFWAKFYSSCYKLCVDDQLAVIYRVNTVLGLIQHWSRYEQFFRFPLPNDHARSNDHGLELINREKTIGRVGKYHNILCLFPQSLHKHCYLLL